MAYIGTSPTQAVRTRFLYTATASQTTFSGADTQNLTLRYSDANFVDVYQNGVLLKGGGADYTATTTTSVVLATGATADDVIEIIVYDVFAVANLIKKDGDTVEGVINFNGKEITLDADFDTSITADTDDRVDIKVGGTDTVHIDASGIGVNINNPLYPLHVTEASGGDTAAIFIDGPTDGTSALFMGDSDDIDIGAIQYDHSSNYMFFRTNASERMRIDSSGNVGIGVTAPSDSTNNGDNLVIGGESNVGMSFLSNATSGNGAIYFADGTSGTAAYRGILSYSHSDDAMDFGTASTAARMRIDSSGNVKIISGNVQFGASGSETGQIEINSTRLLLRSTGDASGLRFDGSAYTPFKNGSQADGTVDLGSSSGKYKDLYLSNSVKIAAATNGTALLDLGDTDNVNIGRIGYDNSDNSMRFTTNSSEAMRIDSSGNVMIGVTSSTALLNVRGQNAPLAVMFNSDNSDKTILQMRHDFARGSQNATMLQFLNNDGNERGSIKTGDSSTSFNTSSDYRLKENVSYDWDATSRLKQLKPCRFNWISDETNTLVDGFLAHEVSSSVLQAVSGEKDAVDKDGKIKPQGIDQSKLVPLLTKSLQEALTRIDTLEAEVKTLKGE
jgi:hypothetical protein